MKPLATGACILALIAAGGCTQSTTTTTTTSVGSGRVNAWTIPHVLRYATAEDISSLNPALSQQSTLGLMSSLTAAWLVKWDRNNRPIPEIATEVPTKANGGVSPDGLTITYHVRKGVRWSDGAPLNADDVVWSIHAILNPANNVVSRTGWDRIKRVDEPNKYTVILHLSRPYSPFVVVFFSSADANPSILPKHILAKYPNFNNVPFDALPVGAGPFMYKAWNRSQDVVMVRNPYYWRGQPKLKEIDFEIVPDRNTVFTELQAHALDLWYPMPGNYFGRIAELGNGFRYLRRPAYLYNHIDFNVSRPAVSDPVVRHALELAIDRKTLLDKIAHGVGILEEEPAPPSAPYFDPNVPFVNFDIAKANAILDADGWTRGSDGIRQKNGVRLALEVASSAGSPDTDSMLALIQQWWKQIGVAMTVRRYESSQLFNTYQAGGIVYNGKWDVVFFAWGNDPIGDYSFVYGCDQIPPNGQNDLHWCNHTADDAMHALFTHYDQAQRNADDTILFQQLAKDVPTIVTYVREDVYAYNRDLKGFHPNSVTPFDDFMNVDI
ncbi:MAG TPA: peptide ABC transporter substrate-binding protein [Candidatus Dormibacteraeota bacterium]|nr:peptide ABC transporter substrate-binding protein [Candidatus Dormibacteraeota bacterium]